MESVGDDIRGNESGGCDGGDGGELQFAAVCGVGGEIETDVGVGDDNQQAQQACQGTDGLQSFDSDAVFPVPRGPLSAGVGDLESHDTMVHWAGGCELAEFVGSGDCDLVGDEVLLVELFTGEFPVTGLAVEVFDFEFESLGGEVECFAAGFFCCRMRFAGDGGSQQRSSVVVVFDE